MQMETKTGVKVALPVSGLEMDSREALGREATNEVFGIPGSSAAGLSKANSTTMPALPAVGDKVMLFGPGDGGARAPVAPPDVPGLPDPPDDLSRLRQIRRVGWLMDANNDTRLSREEMLAFARGLKDRLRREQTRSVLRLVDLDSDGQVSLEEVQAAGTSSSAEALAHQQRRFVAADADGNGQLDSDEFHSFVHPETNENVFLVERDRHFRRFDTDGSGSLDFAEFLRGSLSGSDGPRGDAAAREDFALHDGDSDGLLTPAEFGRLLAGHDLLEHGARKAIEAGDVDGDGHIHLEAELPERLQRLLESEFVEDVFLHDSRRAGDSEHEEL